MPYRLPTQDEKADFVKEQFDRIARRYDLTNDVISLGMHRLWKSQAIDLLVADRQGHYLDVCTGTGDLALMIARRLRGTGQVTGLDFSRGMLDIALNRQRSFDGKKDSLAFVEGDAQSLPFKTDSFDGAVISFGLRNLTDLQAGLNEMSRVVRKGGKIINLDLGRSTLPIFKDVFFLYFRYLVPVVGHLLQADRNAYTYLPESLKTYPEPEKITSMFEKAQLIDVVHYPLSFGSVALHVGTVA